MIYDDGTPIQEGDGGYLKQYDAIVGVTALCNYGSYGGSDGYQPKIKYMMHDTFGQENSDGTPLQLWKVKVYCEENGDTYAPSYNFV